MSPLFLQNFCHHFFYKSHHLFYECHHYFYKSHHIFYKCHHFFYKIVKIQNVTILVYPRQKWPFFLGYLWTGNFWLKIISVLVWSISQGSRAVPSPAPKLPRNRCKSNFCQIQRYVTRCNKLLRKSYYKPRKIFWFQFQILRYRRYFLFLTSFLLRNTHYVIPSIF